MRYLLFFVLFGSHVIFAQDYARDTTFTVNSSFEKHVKKFPFIKKVSSDTFASVAIQRNVTYKNTAERSLHLDVFSLNAEMDQPRPAVMLIHGGGWISGDKSHMEHMAIRLAAEGYLAIAVEYRLSPEAQYPAAMYDLKTAVRWLRANSSDWQIDPTKIAVLGCSAGGQLAALVGVTNGFEKLEGGNDYSAFSSDVHAIVNIDGLLAFHHPESKEGRVASLWLGGSYEEATHNWEEASALTHAGLNNPPILFINSQYPRFHAGRDDMISILDQHGIYSEIRDIPDSPHPFWLFDPWFDPTVEYVVDFLDKTFELD